MSKIFKGLIVLLLVFTVSASMAQTKEVTGKVTDVDGAPVAGATVRVVGGRAGTATDANGEFKFNVLNQIQAVTVSALGYQEKTVSLTGGFLNINLVRSEGATEAGSDVVVTANSIQREKKTLGYATTTIRAEDLTEAKNASVINSLTGKVAGVNITSTAGAPGSSSRIVLRGGSSITGNNQALIVVDGVPIDNSSVIGGTSSLSSVDFGNRGNDINPEDIASITILKGPAAAALYGSRASNGALVITTKSGLRGANKNEITFTSNNTFSSILKLPDFQNEYGQGYYSSIKDGKLVYEADPKENWSWGAPFDGTVREWGQEIDGERLSKPYSAVKNNIRNFFKTGFATDNNLSLSGGGEKASYYLGLNGLYSNNIYPGNNDYYNRNGIRFNGKADLSNKFYTTVNFNYYKINANAVGGGQGGFSVFNNLLQTPRDIPINEMGDLENKYYGYGYTDKDGVYHDNLYGFYGAYGQNPYWILKNYKNYNNVDRITGSFTIGYKANDWLEFLERVGTDYYTDKRSYNAPKFAYYPADKTSGNYSTQNLRSEVGSYSEDNYSVSEVVHDFMATMKKNLNEDLNFSLMVGNNIRQRMTNRTSAATNTSGGLVVPGWYNLANSNGEIVASNYGTNRRLIGVYGELNLGYRDFLFLGATARNDWSSTLPKNNRSFFYPSVNLSFVFSELLRDTEIGKILNYGKLRGGWARVGNDADPYLLATSFVKSQINGGFGLTNFPFSGVPGLMLGSTIGNPDLKPEITTSREIGTEMAFLNSRISVDFSYYHNNSKDQILSIPIPPSTGFGFRVVNAGEVENKGFELGLRGIPVRNKNVTWEIYGTYSRNRNKVLSLMDGVDQIVIGGFNGMSIVAAKGYQYGTFYSVAEAKDDQGRPIVDAHTGMPVPTPSAVYLGSYNPDYIASLGSNFSFKGLSFNILFDTKQGGYFFSRTKDITQFVGTAEITGGNRDPQIWPNSVINVGTIENPKYEVNTDVKYIKQDYFPDAVPGTMVVDGSYIKLRNIGLNYTFPKKMLNSTPFGSLTLGLFGNNLFIWTPSENKYADPEINSAGAGNEQGFDFTAQPSVRNYGINLKLTF